MFTPTLSTTASRAADITIGARFDPSIAPHFLHLSTNMAYAQHIDEPLVARDVNSQPIPGLAESWRTVDPMTWEFKLRAACASTTARNSRLRT